ncbi:MAG: O-antigen ligase family protein [Thermodesulfobacteriota bacterium]|nr:O-antigen ligase family protein [Thermodesulfobacteriota bacterium]
MVRLKFETIKALLTSQYWLILILSGAFFVFFALNRGGIVLFIDLSCVFLFLNALFGEYKLKRIPIFYWITCAICAYLLLASVSLYPQESHFRWMANLVRMLVVVFAIHCLSKKKIADWVPEFFAAIISLTVCCQFAAIYLFHMPHGTFTNIHYLAALAVLVLPIIYYFFWVTTSWHKFLFALIVIMDVDLLLQTGSRPAFLGIIVGTFFVFIFFVKGRYKWFGMIFICFILVTLYLTDYANFASRIQDLIINLAEEERLQLWTKAWNKIKENSLLAWMFGHGIGWSPINYTKGPTFKIALVSSHSFFLEIIYLNGLIGFVLIFGGLSLLFASIVNAARQNQNRKIRLLLKCLIIVFLSWLIHCGLTFPFYSKYSLYPLAFILGTILALVGKTDSDMPVVHEHR